MTAVGVRACGVQRVARVFNVLGCVWERKGVSAQGREGVCARDGDGRIRRLGASDIALNSEAAE